jgi:hypothetical protein
MKLILTFKTPDILDQLEDQTNSEEEPEEAKAFVKSFLTYSEYISVEFDTEAKTATVLKD